MLRNLRDGMVLAGARELCDDRRRVLAAGLYIMSLCYGVRSRRKRDEGAKSSGKED